MIRIANWAQKHIVAARLLIASLHLFVFVCAILISNLLSSTGVFFSFRFTFFITTTGAILIVLIGWLRKALSLRMQKRKLQQFRFLLVGVVCTLLLISSLQNTALKNAFSSHVQAAFIKTETKEMPVYEAYSDKKLFYEDVKAYYHSLSKKELRKVLIYQTRHLNKISENLETAIAILLIGFAASAALGLIAALSCSLACNGQGALAVLVLFGGLALVVVLLVLLGKAYRKSKKKRAAEAKKVPSATTPLPEN